MKRFLKWMIVLTLVLTGLLVAVPFVVPPIVEECVRLQGDKFGMSLDVRLSLGYCWTSTGPGICGKVRLGVYETPWTIDAEFQAAPFTWQASASLPETTFDQTDLLLRKLMETYPQPGVSNRVFSGRISFEGSVRRTFGMPVPVWSAKTQLADLSMRAMMEDKPVSISGFNVKGSVSGIADHVDIAPFFPRADEIVCDRFSLTNFHAVVRATERALLVTEATAGCCGGTVSVYSLFLDPKTLNTGFTAFIDDVDAGQALARIRGFKGTASGRLHGKTRLWIAEGGRRIRLRESYLYSKPGETGKIRMEDSAALTDSLAMAGLDAENRENVGKALTDLDYDVLRLDLNRRNDSDADLGIRIEGSATRGSVTAPVVLDLRLHGDIEQIINTGLGLTNSNKGSKK